MPSRPWLDAKWKELNDSPIIGVTWLFTLMMVIALPYGIYRAVKDLRGYRARKPA